MEPTTPPTTAGPPTPLTIAFTTIGDTRTPSPSPHNMQALMVLNAEGLGASIVIRAKDGVAALKQLELKVPMNKDGVTPSQFIQRVIFLGHGQIPAGDPAEFAYSGSPPPPPDTNNLHFFTFGVSLKSAFTGPDISLLDALAQRFVIGKTVEIWFVTCFIGKKMAPAVAKHYADLSKQKKNGVVSGYDGEIGFGWNGTEAFIRKAPSTPIAAIHMDFDTSVAF